MDAELVQALAVFFNLTFGTNSSSGSNGVVFIRVTLRNTSALSPTNMAIIGT